MGAWLGLALAVLAVVWCAGAVQVARRLDVTFWQGFWLAPLMLAFRIQWPDSGLPGNGTGPAIVLVSRQSGIDSLLMTLALPRQTEHDHMLVQPVAHRHW